MFCMLKMGQINKEIKKQNMETDQTDITEIISPVNSINHSRRRHLTESIFLVLVPLWKSPDVKANVRVCVLLMTLKMLPLSYFKIK